MRQSQHRSPRKRVVLRSERKLEGNSFIPFAYLTPMYLPSSSSRDQLPHPKTLPLSHFSTASQLALSARVSLQRSVPHHCPPQREVSKTYKQKKIFSIPLSLPLPLSPTSPSASLWKPNHRILSSFLLASRNLVSQPRFMQSDPSFQFPPETCYRRFVNVTFRRVDLLVVGRLASERLASGWGKKKRRKRKRKRKRGEKIGCWKRKDGDGVES